ncbi:hypothetical protein N431DRAFT_438564 [Stipitochalara longipes BDJ]|nr:hypothetical protein N431DRAFT_438564 [Stipitochalara longipes BDJ]
MFAAYEGHQTLPPFTPKAGRISLQAPPKPQNREFASKLSASFPILRLSPELRNEIYAHYFAFLPPLKITPENVTSPLHQQTQLSLSTPYFEFDILPSIFYRNCTFSFSSLKSLRQFAKGEGRDRVAKVRIDYGRLSRCHHTDWVFLLFRYFGNLEEVMFCLQTDDMEADENLFGQWWKCVRDATREAANSQIEDIITRRNTGVRLKVECREWNISAILGGSDK